MAMSAVPGVWGWAGFAMRRIVFGRAVRCVCAAGGRERVGLQVLPVFGVLSWSSYLLGLVEVCIDSWYAALVFGSIYNFIAARSDR